MKKYLGLIIVILISCSGYKTCLFSQSNISLDNWKTYSSLLNVTTADIDSKGRIWCGTSGGVFCYDPTNGDIREFRNLDGLLSLDISKIAANNTTKEIYIGTADGYLHIITEDFIWLKPLTEIIQPKFTNPSINDIIFKDSIAYIAGGFGITLLDIYKKVFLETPARLGSFQSHTQVYQLLIYNNRLWAATDEGIASAAINSSFIPTTWINYGTNNGLPSNPVKGLGTFQDSLYCYIDTTVYKFDIDSFKLAIVKPAYEPISKLSTVNGKLQISTPFEIFDEKLNPSQVFYRMPDSSYINYYVYNKINNELIVMLKDNGIVIIKDTSKIHIKPHSPFSNSFASLSVAPDGSLWSATDIGKGFMKLQNDDSWVNFTANKYPEMLYNVYFFANALPDGRIIMSSKGFGYLSITNENGNYNLKRIANNNSPLKGNLNDSDNYVWAGESAYDVNTGLLWVLDVGTGSFNAPLLVASDHNNNFYPVLQGYSRHYLPMAIDFSGTKWVGSFGDDGLLWFNEGADIKNSDAYQSGTISSFSSNSKLPPGEVKKIVVDKNGILWIGTSTGLGYILSPSAVLRKDGNPIARTTSVTLLQSQTINDIMIDALNNKWVATNQGVWVLDAEGATEIAQINISNSPITTNEVISLATDENTGRIFFGTEKGLSSAYSFSIKPLDSYNIKCYPQPFIPIIDNLMVIDGLAANSDVRILTINGKLVKSISTGSQKVTWDGRDNDGSYVSSGVYMVVGKSLTSDASGIAKFMVIRK